jgi:uncharacterized membrane protein (UPF0127 family)
MDFKFYNPQRIIIDVDYCDTKWKQIRGLMFKSKSKPLLFKFKKNQPIRIHSLFCKPFHALWLDDNKHVIKAELIDKQRFSISGEGRYLLEIIKL